MEYDHASVKVMRSYDYCHFEVVLGRDNGQALNEYNVKEMRKEAARLVDSAVEDYRKMQAFLRFKNETAYEYGRLQDEVKKFHELEPDTDKWSDKQKALKKRLEDLDYYRSLEYDYQDDFDPDYPDDDYNGQPY